MDRKDADLVAGLTQLGILDRSSDTAVTEQAKDYMLRAAARLEEMAALLVWRNAERLEALNSNARQAAMLSNLYMKTAELEAKLGAAGLLKP